MHFNRIRFVRIAFLILLSQLPMVHEQYKPLEYQPEESRLETQLPSNLLSLLKRKVKLGKSYIDSNQDRWHFEKFENISNQLSY